MKECRPKFDEITSFDEFKKYYWYRDELSQICKSLGLEYRGTKQELNYIIEQYFKGDLIKKSSIKMFFSYNCRIISATSSVILGLICTIIRNNLNNP